MFLQSPDDFIEANLLFVVLLDRHLHGYWPVRISFLLEDYVQLNREWVTVSSSPCHSGPLLDFFLLSVDINIIKRERVKIYGGYDFV